MILSQQKTPKYNNHTRNQLNFPTNRPPISTPSHLCKYLFVWCYGKKKILLISSKYCDLHENHSTEKTSMLKCFTKARTFLRRDDAQNSNFSVGFCNTACCLGERARENPKINWFDACHQRAKNVLCDIRKAHWVVRIRLISTHTCYNIQ